MGGGGGGTLCKMDGNAKQDVARVVCETHGCETLVSR